MFTGASRVHAWPPGAHLWTPLSCTGFRFRRGFSQPRTTFPPVNPGTRNLWGNSVCFYGRDQRLNQVLVTLNWSCKRSSLWGCILEGAGKFGVPFHADKQLYKQRRVKNIQNYLCRGNNNDDACLTLNMTSLLLFICMQKFRPPLFLMSAH